MTDSQKSGEMLTAFFGCAFFFLLIYLIVVLWRWARKRLGNYLTARHRRFLASLPRTDSEGRRIYSVREVIENASTLLGQQVIVSGFLLAYPAQHDPTSSEEIRFDCYLVDVKERVTDTEGFMTVPRPSLPINNEYFWETLWLSGAGARIEMGKNPQSSNLPFTLTATLSPPEEKGADLCLTAPTLGVTPDWRQEQASECAIPFCADRSIMRLRRSEEGITEAIEFHRQGGGVLCHECLAEITFQFSTYNGIETQSPDLICCPNNRDHLFIQYAWKSHEAASEIVLLRK